MIDGTTMQIHSKDPSHGNHWPANQALSLALAESES